MGVLSAISGDSSQTDGLGLPLSGFLLSESSVAPWEAGGTVKRKLSLGI